MIVSLTFDDGLDCHLDVAMPLLAKHGWHGTFFVNLNSLGFCGRLPDWQAAAKRGNELGNHTIFHPAVSGKSYVTEGNCLENYTLDRMRVELTTANQILTALDGRKERTFAYPCCNPVLGRPGWSKRLLKKFGLDRTRLMSCLNQCPALDLVASQADYSSLLPELFVAARAGGYPTGRGPVPLTERYKVPCLSADGKTADQLIGEFEAAKMRVPWVPFMFHGIGSGHHLSCTETDFQALLKHLSGDPNNKVMPFLAAAKTHYSNQ
ncbi:MAG: polysaccharide deacetylase family protein [Verrucomicrobiota bacterium]